VKHTLRSIESPGQDWSRKRYTWRKGTIQPFSSLWITVLRFTLLNRPKFDSLNLDLQGPYAARTRRAINFSSFLPWPLHSTIDIGWFASALGEPIEAFRWASVADFPWGIQGIFGWQNKICPICLAHGFHTVVFSARCIQRCPRHGETLLASCPDCGGRLNDRSKPWSGVVPRICDCGNEWLTMATARSPTPDTQRDEVLSDLIRWTEAAGQRCWAYLHRSKIEKQLYADRELQIDTLEHYVERWRREQGLPTPDFLLLPERPSDPSLDRCIQHSGFRPGSLARVQRAGTAILSSLPPVVPRSISQEPIRLFKSVRRYLVKHVLGNRVALMVWVGKNLSAPEFRRRTAAEPNVRVAWAVLYWMLSTHWEHGVKRWFRGLLGITKVPRGNNDPTYHWTEPIQNHVVIHYGGALEHWIVSWVNASALLDVWPTQEDFERHSTDEAFMWPRTAPTRQPIRWWAWIAEDGHLALGIYRRRTEWLEPARRTSKQERIEAHACFTAARRQMLREGMSAQVIRLTDDGRWLVEARRHFPADADLRTSRLHTGSRPASRFGVGRDPRPTADPDAPWYVRSLSYPVCVTSGDVKSGIVKLKLAVKMYVKATRSSLPSSVNPAAALPPG
jgi:hypothetical protein